ncbi:uncharacterized protein LOC128746026 [Sabethes cyaneus]|uniref:uncharacterized protein LOC128735880 n=1 Tax=Sabethes cyaneus TaxID=53552 RepID=UPI00237EAEF1|nr:uncharacterized protein LOC128735880 [Sabethes cyaneus]XP_053691746.1 uncharacterized protein LOC128740237 [Sabethes cyaneus]XP_053699054.1 uncharacterized protein LOC128746026 [Sabethes cyaneus]
MACHRCKKTVTASDRIVCQGFCGATFHVICAKVDDPVREALGIGGNNVFWMCDPCAELFSSGHFRALLTDFDGKCSSFMPKAIQSMRDDIDKLHTALTALTAKVDAKPNANTPYATPIPWPNVTRSTGLQSTPKRRRGNSGNPVSPPSTMTVNTYGTKAAHTIRTVNLHRKQDEDMAWIYLSAFHPSTTEKEIASLVTECLALHAGDQPKVVKLVPTGKDPATLNFVSFKIGVNQQFKDKALCCETWPENVRFRLFEDYRTKNAARIVKISPKEISSRMPPVDSDHAHRIEVDE